MYRENDLLKHQLKKYVGAVQMLRQQGARPEGILSLNSIDRPECCTLKSALNKVVEDLFHKQRTDIPTHFLRQARH
jgi:hypothetical protein